MPEIVSTLLAFVFALGAIIFVHELGHFTVAKAFGMKVLTFSLGFGRRLWGFRRGETEYKIAWLPLGGYVKLSGEDATGPTDDPRDFVNRPRWQRILVYVAGPASNFVFSLVLIAGLFMVGIEVPALQSIPSEVGTVEPGSPGEAAGLVPGDRIVEIGGREVDRWHDVAFAIMTSIGKPVPLVIERGGERLSLAVTPVKPADFDFGDAGIFPKILPRIGKISPGSPAEKAGLLPGDELRAVDGRALTSSADLVAHIEPRAGQTVALELVREGRRLELAVVPADDAGKGRIGVTLTIAQRLPFAAAFAESARFNYGIARQSLAVIGKIFKREVAARSALAGPIEIAAQSGAAARSGLKDLLYLMGVISVSIGLLNLFPIPILDGGQITILLVESVIRRDLSDTLKERFAQVGLAVIVLLMVTVLWFDVSKRLLAD
jgi:regulator of sigma E protease